MDGKQQFAGLAGITLLAANFWTSDAHKAFAGGALSHNASGAQQAAAHAALKKYGGALLGVAAGVLLAGASDQAGTAVIAVIVALFILWAMGHYAGFKPTPMAQAPAQGGYVKNTPTTGLVNA